MSDAEALATLCSMDFMPPHEPGRRNCLIAVDDGAGGGMGAVMGSIMEFILLSFQHNCAFVHRTGTLAKATHAVNKTRLDDYFGFGRGCLAWFKPAPRVINKDQQPEGSTEELIWGADVPGGEGTPPPDGTLHAVVHHGVSSVSGVSGPCGAPEELEEPTLCLLGRGRIRKVSSRNPLLARQVVRYWWKQTDMPEKKPTWFQEVNAGKKGYHVNIVVHLRRGDVMQFMKSRFVSNEYMTEVMQLLAREITEVKAAVAADTSRAGKAVTRAGLSFHVHLASQGEATDFPLSAWSKILGTADTTLTEHVAATGRSKLQGQPDPLVLPTFTHMALADMLFHGHSSYPALVDRFYGVGIARTYGSEEEKEKLPLRFREQQRDDLVAYVLSHADTRTLWLEK